jgi:ATP-binding cassette, subfamily B, multidrug efflux pump
VRQLRRLLPYLARRRGSLSVGIVCLLVTTALALAFPWVLRYAIDDLTQLVTMRKLVGYAAVILVLAVLEGLFRYTMRTILIGMSREVEYEIRNDLFVHLTRLPASYYQQQRIGDIMSRAANDLSAVRQVLGPGIMYSANTLVTFVATVALMLKIHVVLVGISLVPLVAVSFAVLHFGRRIHDRFEKVQGELANMNTVVQESLAGIRVVRAYVQEEQEKRRFAESNDAYLDQNRRLALLSGILYPGIQLLMGLGVTAVLWYGGRLVITGAITLGQFVAFNTYLALLQWPMIAVGWVVNIFERGEASMGRIGAIQDAPPIVASGTPPSAPIHGDVEFRGLSLSLGGPPILQDVNLKVPAGAVVALVGPTGSGKSTLVNLLPRLVEPPRGTVFIDGHDVLDLPLATLRAAIGFVPQEPFLFSTTVRDNIAFGAPRETAAESLDHVAEVSQIARDVQQFPQGYETPVGERGITLSGGQKQRTALARALAVDPRILVLDDAFSAVDTETEERILRGLRDARQGRTTFLVSHRVSTVKDADVIVVLQAGRIVESGTHEALIGSGGFYAALNRRQLLEREVENA